MPKHVTKDDIYYLELIHKRIAELYMDVLDDSDAIIPYSLQDEVFWLKNFINEHKKAM